jgi:hypothetical protein
MLAYAAVQVLSWAWTAAGHWLRVRACPAQTTASFGTGAEGSGAGSNPVKTVAMGCYCFLAGGWAVMVLGAVRVLSWGGTLLTVQAGWACHRRYCHC